MKEGTSNILELMVMLATAEPDKPLTRTIKAEDEDDTQVFWHAEHVQVAVISLLTSASVDASSRSSCWASVWAS